MSSAMWDQRYSEPGFAYGTEPNDFLQSVMAKLPRGRALCLGEGEGRNAIALAGLGYDVTAVDQSAEGLAKAARFAEERGVHIETVTADLAGFPIEEMAWDVIVSIWIHLPPALRHDVHRRSARGLRLGGAIVLEAYNPAQLALRTGGPSDVSMLMTEAALRDDFQGLRFEILREIERDVHEGRFHDGPSAVVQVLARRDR